MGANPHSLYDTLERDERLALGRLGLGKAQIRTASDLRRARKMVRNARQLRNRLPNPMLPEVDSAEAESARELHEDFHGQESKKYRVASEPHVPPGDYAQLGPFVSLAIKPTESGSAYPKVMAILLPGKKVYVIASPDGYPFYIVGDSELDESEIAIFTDSTENRVFLGEGRVIAYLDTKWGSDVALDARGEEIEWNHAFGEEGGTRPQIYYDRAMRRLILQGGSYRAEGSWMRD
jgi:hypothetical protein